jgi:hypothetical protein
MTATADFWSRRKARVAAEDQVEAQRQVALTDAEEQARLDACSDEDVLAELNLPDPDTLKMGDDFSGFMARAVPERLRRRALRKLWVSNPVLACVDGLNDYDEDYNIVAVSGSAMKTAYQVGRGFARDILADVEGEDAPAIAADPNADASAEGAPETALAAAAPPDGVAQTPEAAHGGTDVIPTSYRHDTDTPSEPEMAPRRRMRFAFDGASDTPQESLA